MTHLLKSHYGGWTPQRPDARDHEFVGYLAQQATPPAFELPGVDEVPLINQGQQGSCTGHGTDGVVMYDLYKQGQPVVVMSRAMIYYDARIPEGTTGQDSGAQVRDAVAGVVKYGVVPDSEFPYSDQVFDVAPTPPDYADAKKDEALAYEAVAYPHLNATIAAGFPFVFGFTVYQSFESDQVAQTGVVPIPAAGEQTLGGHCVWCFGYNATYQPWTAPSGRTYPPRTKACRNSWMDATTPPWGDHGNFYLPQWFFDNGQASDYWVINRVGAAAG